MQKQPYGVTAAGDAVMEYTLTNAHGVEVKIITYGGTITSIRLPGRDGEAANVVLGFATLQDYEQKSPYLGCITGRYANRIAGGKFTLDGKTHQLHLNDGPNSLHGGRKGFDKVVWDVAREIDGAEGSGIALHYTSPDGEEHFPGALDTTVTYLLNDQNELRIHYRATTDQPTVVNLTNHTLWNLGGEGLGSVEDHLLQIDAEEYTPVDAAAIPLGAHEAVAGTPFDFRTPTAVGARIRSGHQQIVYGKGYDHNWVLARAGAGAADLAPAATLHHAASGRRVEVWTTEPGVQVYTGNFLSGALYGTSGHAYRQGDGIALETQHFPDSPNQEAYPTTVLRPGEVYDTTTVFRFGVA